MILACRDAHRGNEAIARVRVDVPGSRAALVSLDLADLDSVRSAAALVREAHPALDLLVCNAGAYQPERRRSGAGAEMTMAVNHLGHFLLAKLLRDALATARGRVVVVTSDAHRAGDLRRAPIEAILRGDVAYHPMRAYADSKLANLLFALELGRRSSSDGITVVAVHPGMIASGFWSHGEDRLSRLMRLLRPLARSPEHAAKLIVFATESPAAAPGNAVYLHGRRLRKPAGQASDAALAAELWAVSDAFISGLAA